MGSYFSRHLQVLFSTLGDMRRTPMASINTIVIVAVTLLLPSLLYITVTSAQSLSSNWQGRPQISIFLQHGIEAAESELIFEEIQLHPAIALAEFVSPKQALEEFKLLSGLQNELDFLDGNPIPPSIVVMPELQFAQPERLLELKEQLEKIDGIEMIRLDLDWTDRFNAILDVVTHVAGLLSALLAVALVLIVGNTIRLLITHRRHEIEITKLVGGTDAFVRRPFLYYGSLFGLFGALITLLLLWGAGELIEDPMSRLSGLYGGQQLLHQLEFREIGTILGIGTLLGWFAARWSVAQHLRNIQPQ